MRILLVDDHVLFRQGLKFLLSDLDQSVEFIEADNCAQVPQVADGQDIDIVLLDLYLPDSDGLEALRKVRDLLPTSTIVVLSSEDDPHIIRTVVDEGAAGFIPKSSTQEVMIAALRLVLAGDAYLPSHALQHVHDETPQELVQPTFRHQLQSLTDRQREVLDRAMQGKANKIIAREMGITEATVKAHLSACFRALGVKNRTEAVFAAANSGMRNHHHS